MPRIVRFHETGAPEVLRLDDLPMPAASGDDVVISVRAFGLNRAEIMFRRGLYPQYDPELPSALGYEAAGTVLAVGPKVGAVKVGDRVSTVPSFKMGYYFTYGEVARVPEHAVMPLPANLSWHEGAAVWMPYMTVWGAFVEYGKLVRGETIVIRAASSSVGVAAMQMARELGATVIAVTRDGSKRDFIARQKPDHIVTSQGGDMAEQILGITDGRGADMVFDPVAGPELVDLARATRYHGRIFVYGRLGGEPSLCPVALGLAKGLTLRGYSLFEVINFPEVFARGKAAVAAGLAAGRYRPEIDRVYALEDIIEAHRHMESNSQCGKIVVAGE
jgi:NADPH:quinone reductase-like Zn-dependent oxidoreductase